MEELSIKGGLRTSSYNVTKPFALLQVDKQVLIIKLKFFETIILTQDEILGIIPFSGSTSNGIKIIHKNNKYDSRLIFWTRRQPELLIQNILQTGLKVKERSEFNNEEKKIWEKEYDKGNPLKFSGLIPFFSVLPICYLFDECQRTLYKNQTIVATLISILSVGIVFLSLSNFSKKFRKLIVKDGFDYENIRFFTILLLLSLIGFLIYIIFQII